MAGITRATPGRMLAVQQINATQTGFLTEADITGLTIAFTMPGKTIWVVLYAPAVKQNTATGTVLVKVTDASNNAIAYASKDLLSGVVDGPIWVPRRITTSVVAAGTASTYKARASTTAGTVDVRAGGDTIPAVNGPAYLMAYEEW